tara:strand:- start:9 stop:1040 length:1032 start_codon:yes stop_codon:yes gene_type:complete
MAYTTVNKSTDFFSANIYTGDGSSSRALTGFGHQPDWIYVKRRDGTSHPTINDSVMGATLWRYTSRDQGDDTSTQAITYGTDGLTWNGGNYDSNTNTYTYVAWSLKAGTSSGLSGGTITPSAYSINTTSKFGIYKYTGTGSNGTIAHGLGTTPKMIWVKKTSGTEDWRIYHQGAGDATKYMTLNSTGAVSTASTVWNSTAPTSTLFSIGTDGGVNTNGQTYIAYVWGEVSGFSKFGTYVGDSSNYPFVNLPFKPAFIMIKSVSTTNWNIFDNKRETFNQVDYPIWANTNAAEQTDPYPIDMVSNGFTVRTNSSQVNNNNTDHIYMAFAEVPLVGTNNVPATAR